MRKIDVIKVLMAWLLSMGVVFATLGLFYAYHTIVSGLDVYIVPSLAMLITSVGSLVMFFLVVRLYFKIYRELKK
jgi:hypothetical protein